MIFVGAGSNPRDSYVGLDQSLYNFIEPPMEFKDREPDEKRERIQRIFCHISICIMWAIFFIVIGYHDKLLHY